MLSFHKLFKGCFTFGHDPKLWSAGYITITSFYNYNNIPDPNNNRGFTVTNAIRNYFITDDCQMGLTRKAGTTSDHMYILQTIVDQYCTTKDGRVYVCFVDFQKASVIIRNKTTQN